MLHSAKAPPPPRGPRPSASTYLHRRPRSPRRSRPSRRRTRESLTHNSLYGPQHGLTPNCATWAQSALILASASSPGGGGGGGEASGFIAGKSSTSRIEFLFVRNMVNLSIPVWKSTSASGAPDNSSRSHFSALTRPSWLGRAVRNRHRHAIEQAARRWRGGRRDDSARTRRKFDFRTGDNSPRGRLARHQTATVRS